MKITEFDWVSRSGAGVEIELQDGTLMRGIIEIEKGDEE